MGVERTSVFFYAAISGPGLLPKTSSYRRASKSFSESFIFGWQMCTHRVSYMIWKWDPSTHLALARPHLWSQLTTRTMENVICCGPRKKRECVCWLPSCHVNLLDLCCYHCLLLSFDISYYINHNWKGWGKEVNRFAMPTKPSLSPPPSCLLALVCTSPEHQEYAREASLMVSTSFHSNGVWPIWPPPQRVCLFKAPTILHLAYCG